MERVGMKSPLLLMEVQKQIPFGNDKQKGKGNYKSKGNSRFPLGMTNKKATATTKARAKADSLRE